MVLVVAGFAVAAWSHGGLVRRLRRRSRASARRSPGDSLRAVALRVRARCGAGLLVPGGLGPRPRLATLALTRWGGGRLGRCCSALLFVTPLALPAGGVRRAGPVEHDCSGDKLEAFAAWADDGSKGQPPYDCRTF